MLEGSTLWESRQAVDQRFEGEEARLFRTPISAVVVPLDGPPTVGMINTESRQEIVTANDTAETGAHDVRRKRIKPNTVGLPSERCEHGRVGQVAAQRDAFGRAPRTRPPRYPCANQDDAINRPETLNRRLSLQSRSQQRQHQHERAAKRGGIV